MTLPNYRAMAEVICYWALIQKKPPEFIIALIEEDLKYAQKVGETIARNRGTGDE